MSGPPRWAVFAPYPTMRGPEALWALERVKELVDRGADVVVISPRPSAAHLFADPGGLRGATRLLRHLAGREHAVVRLDASALRADADTRALLAPRAALASALRRVPEVELVLDRVPPVVAPRWASMIAARATRIVVATPAEREALAAAGVARGTVEIDPALGPDDVAPRGSVDATAAVDDAGVAPLRAGATASDLEELIRRRAAAGRTDAAGTGHAPPASLPLRHLEPLARPRIATRKPGVATAKRVELRALAWMFDAVIQHVNHLHRATIEALDVLDDRAAGDGRTRGA
ncbi:MAG TPA: hypothetical protein VFV35_04265 [Acidimicrobiales bacterium]|nr:hypothetical protein [Acidimicrobiales bacterium]